MFHIWLLEKNTTKKGRVSEEVPKLDVGNKGSEKYKVEAIWDNAVYARESKSHLPGLYYLVAWKDYSKKENTWEPLSAI